MSTIIKAEGLRKSYADFEAVKGIDFAVQRSSCFGFLGPNGAGKTSTMQMIYRAASVSGGKLEILGLNASDDSNDREIKKALGVVPQETNLQDRLSVEENLLIFTKFYNLYGQAAQKRINELIAFANLEDKRTANVDTLSGGMRRRLLIARSLIGDPEILILDEPTTGLDPQARHNLWDQLLKLKAQDKTIILTTHYMDEAEKLCDDLVVMDQGKVIDSGHPHDLIDQHIPTYVLEVWQGGENSLPDPTDALAERAKHWKRLPHRILLYTDNGEELFREASAAYGGARINLRRASLEDVFLKLTGHTLTE